MIGMTKGVGNDRVGMAASKRLGLPVDLSLLDTLALAQILNSDKILEKSRCGALLRLDGRGARPHTRICAATNDPLRPFCLFRLAC
jgi:hypothetical protein